MIQLLAAAALFLPVLSQREAPAVPDLTAGGEIDDKHDWTLGPTGARGWIWGWNRETTRARQVLVTEVLGGSPADGVLEVGDVLLGVGGATFDGDPRPLLGDAITAAETREGGGRLVLERWRAGETESVAVELPVLGSYSGEAPWNCAKSELILQRACEHIAVAIRNRVCFRHSARL